MNPSWWKRLWAYLLSGWRPWALVIGLGCVLYFPFLGSSGLWDPWEPHYAEVAREMVESGNWLDPTWEHNPGQSFSRKYFWSKPILSMWLMAIPMQIFGVQADSGGIVTGAEWYLRFPFALTAIMGLLGIFALARRFFGVKVGLLAAVILGTCAQYYFIARQAMTDMPFIGLMTAGMSLMILGGFDEKPRLKLP
jgi:4-amino-4-deoxy-L-arabinose transferase-like glycosyltransferase